MVRTIAVTCVVMAGFPGFPSAVRRQDQADRGREIFRRSCSACHTVGGGRLVGPDLKGVGERRSEQWILRFVQHSQDLVAAGDPDAVAIFGEFNGITMPDQPLSDEEIRGVIEYIRGAASVGAVAVGREQQTPVVPATGEQILLGQGLFQGKTRFTNGGPTCNSCHEVKSDGVMGGGALARELTTVVSRLGGPGVRAILGRSPFPVMQRGYQDRPLTDDEVTALVAFLQRADEEEASHQPTAYGVRLFVAGVAGLALLLGIYTLIWSNRKKGAVYQPIFDRQVGST